MSENLFSLSMNDDTNLSAARGWLTLALSSLVGAGLVVILIILARMPVIHDLIPWTGSFKTALVVHVDLTVLVWFLSFAGFLASLTIASRAEKNARIALALSATGAILLTFSPFLGADRPFINNYVPVLANAAFFSGLACFAAGFFAVTLPALSKQRAATHPGEKSLQFGLTSSFLIAWLALGLLVWSYVRLPGHLLQTDGAHYFELLFWGSGHVLQFTYTQLEIVAWFWLASALGRRTSLTPNGLVILFILGALPTVVAPIQYLMFDLDSPEFRLAMTNLMAYGNGAAAIPAALILLHALSRAQNTATPSRPEQLALLFSLVLFAFGGIIGFLIRGVNVTIPAHYHGSIVSITLAFMGVTYHVIPRLGGCRIAEQWASRQLILYSSGSLLHILGLAWSGSHGVQRKTEGSAQGLVTLADKIPMWIMGLGGIIAVLGGIMFLVLAFRSLRREGSN
ncbi:MAG: cbb3-type cytochrome c oxidase subunit I [Magnetococcales bacterium]|nr:cbb3-type cytochrome c oxidase subunit I [Magnetococcales bacterium]